MNTPEPDNLTIEERETFDRYVRARERGISVTGDFHDADDTDFMDSLKDHIRLLRKAWPIPPGLKLCPQCLEYSGTTQRKYLKTSYTLENPNDEISIYCKCQGPMCPYCKKVRIRKPGGCYYRVSGIIVYCSGLFTILRGCDECNRKRNEDRETRDKGD